jgi:hypothetical protein
MAITIAELKSRGIDYIVASIEDGQLVLEPFCSCGTVLDENYHCPECQKVCDCTVVACSDAQALGIVEKLVAGNPGFRNLEAALIVK